MPSIRSLLFLVLPLAAAETIRINVGEDGLVFSPDNVQAEDGDVLDFRFYPRRHSVTQSSFDAPCVPLQDGVNSGFVPVEQGDQTSFQVTVTNSSAPMWLYCAQTTGNHCQAGMVMVVNEPQGNAERNLAAYRTAAASTGPSEIGSLVSGGQLTNGTGGQGGGYGNGTAPTGTPSPTPTGAADGDTTGAASIGNVNFLGTVLGSVALVGALMW